MTKYLKVRVVNEPEITADGVSSMRSERLWHEVLHPTTTGYHCKLNSTPVVVDAPDEMDITYDAILEEIEQ